MITIARGPVPAVLRNAPPDSEDYARPEVVQALWDMQCRKCCYCEQAVPDLGQGRHVEHFRPKSRDEFAPLRNTWANLLLACPTCNGQKGDQFPVDAAGRAVLIDPSSKRIDPARHIEFVVDYGDDDPTGLPVPRSPRGRATIEVIGLYLSHYVRERRRHFRTIVRPRYEALLNAKDSGDAEMWAVAKAQFEDLLSGLWPFAGFVRCFARRKQLDRIGVAVPTGSCN